MSEGTMHRMPFRNHPKMGIHTPFFVSQCILSGATREPRNAPYSHPVRGR
jgi:hypothetical protein